MMIFDKHYINLYNGDTVTYNKNKYTIEINEGYLRLYNQFEEIYIDYKNNDVMSDIEKFIEPFEYANGLFE